MPILIYIYTEVQAACHASSEVDLGRKEALYAKVTNSAMHALLMLACKILQTPQHTRAHKSSTEHL